jgi:predicted Co/Zn/Cd cation transporter (cation efflux family)
MAVTDEEAFRLEKRSLDLGKWVNLFMAFAGVTAAILSNADALLLDGLFSGVNFVSALVAARVAVSIQRKPDATRPFGYEINESVYVMFRGLVLTGIIIMALLGALDKIITYWRTGEAMQIELNWILMYTALMVVLCFGLSFWYNHNWRRGGRRSNLLATESKAARIDGYLSASAGIAFLGLSLLKGGPLEFLVPVSDSIVIVVLAVFMVPQPFSMFLDAAREILGVSLAPEDVSKLEAEVRIFLKGRPFKLLRASAARTGRSVFHLLYLYPDGAVTAGQIDRLRDEMNAQIGSLWPGRIEITLAQEAPY